jgi:hypothetical protein
MKRTRRKVRETKPKPAKCPETINNAQCARIVFGRKVLFTSLRNVKYLVGPLKSLSAYLSIVKVQTAVLLDLKQIAEALNSAEYKNPTVAFEVVTERIDKAQVTVNYTKFDLIEAPKMGGIKDAIKTFIDKRKIVSNQAVRMYLIQQGYVVTPAACSYYFSLVRKQLEAEQGYEFVRVQPGLYRKTV